MFRANVFGYDLLGDSPAKVAARTWDNSVSEYKIHHHMGRTAVIVGAKECIVGHLEMCTYPDLTTHPVTITSSGLHADVKHKLKVFSREGGSQKVFVYACHA